MGQTNCPRCETQLKESSACFCGWVDPRNIRAKSDRSVDLRIMKILAGTCVGVLLMYAQILTWGTFFVEGPYLHLKQMSGVATDENLIRLSELCKLRGNVACVESTLADRTKVSGKPEAFADLGRFLYSQKQYNKALAAYEGYFSQSKSPDARTNFEMGRLLFTLEKDAQAISYLQASIDAKVDVLATHPTQVLVQAYIRLGQLDKAYEQVLTFHASAENAKGYMNKERKDLEEKLGKEAIVLQKKFEASRGSALNSPKKLGNS